MNKMVTQQYFHWNWSTKYCFSRQKFDKQLRTKWKSLYCSQSRLKWSGPVQVINDSHWHLGVKNYPNLRDVIYEQPLRYHVFQIFFYLFGGDRSRHPERLQHVRRSSDDEPRLHGTSTRSTITMAAIKTYGINSTFVTVISRLL